MSILEHAFETIGVEITPLTWFLIVFVSYFFIGFGSSKFNFKANRFYDTHTGRFVKWENVLFFGILAEILLMTVAFKTMGFWDVVGAISSLFICILLTILLGRSTRKY